MYLCTDICIWKGFTSNCSLEHPSSTTFIVYIKALARLLQRLSVMLQACSKMHLLLLTTCWLATVTTCPLKTTIPSEIKFGYLVHVDYPQVLGAVSLAVERINNDSSILPNTSLSFRYENLSGERYEAIQVMTRLRDENISAFIGPDESCRYEAMIASAWNLPMVAYVRYFGTIKEYKKPLFLFFPEMFWSGGIEQDRIPLLCSHYAASFTPRQINR